MNRLYFVRHGENLANLTKEFSYKKVDYPLTEKGVLQAQQTASYFSTKSLKAVYSSPLQRAAQTASIIAKVARLPVHIEEDLREVNVGSLEGQPVSQKTWEAHNAIIRAWRQGKSGVNFPEGENQYQMVQRFASVLERILKMDASHEVVVVGHGGLFTFGLPLLFPKIKLDHLVDIPNHNCSISTFDVAWEIDHFEGQMVEWAQINHLSGAAADFVNGYPQAGELKN